ncbi:SLC13 family permease [Lacipirellula limnantheis]|uniref:Potassium transporter peripheral membrane component n=1 Tax=Lacipirellula limnantheis TaxID=2528024 RepID=A0A517TXT1_9BACT|nr:SLC13 family permease [Lacipirellula limnantheis]QDT73182.1 potassium transporter peripheral membrane component [Lacipirellula limnantheis]
MNAELAIVVGLLAAAIAMFAINKPRMDAVALIMLTMLPFTGVVTVGETLAGFADPNIVLIAVLFVLGDGLVRTGVARRLGDWLAAKAGGSETRLLALLMLVVCGLGSSMSSTAVTAIFIPVALRIADNMRISPSRLMMPLSFAALISGMMTLIATAPNLVVNSELIRQGFDGFQFFSFTPFGAPILALAIVYMTFASRWLSSTAEEAASGRRRPRMADWIDEYHLSNREHRVRILPGSMLAGTTLAAMRLGVADARLVAIDRNATLIQPESSTELRVGDILYVDVFASETTAAEMRRQFGLEELPLTGAYFSDMSQEIGMAEVIVPATSPLAGQSIADASFRDRYGLTVVGLRRSSAAFDGELQHEDLKVGDTLLVIGPWRAIRNLQQATSDLVAFNLPVELDDVLPVPGKALQAVICLLIAIGLMVSGVVPNVQAALIGCLLMGLCGCVDLNSAYRSIDWKTLVLIVGMLPFSIALERTGGVDLAADLVMNFVGGAGVRVVLATIFAITAILGMFISNTATAVLMAPVAISIAEELGLSPRPFAMIVALAASTAFMTPVSSPVNTLVVTPGRYTFGDFIKLGVPFSLIVMAVSVALVPWLLPP